MNWEKYLINQLEIDCRQAQDQGYEFHFSWLLILIAFIAWELPVGATFLEIKPFEQLAAKFCTLWYSSDMNKQWQPCCLPRLLHSVEECHSVYTMHHTKHTS